LGLAIEQPDPFFFTFVEDKYGIRAAVKILMTYQDKYKLKTIRQLINRWAPPNENNTDAYVDAVAKEVNVAPDTPVNVNNLNICLPLIRAIIKHENGQQPYDDAELSSAITMAYQR